MVAASYPSPEDGGGERGLLVVLERRYESET